MYCCIVLNEPKILNLGRFSEGDLHVLLNGLTGQYRQLFELWLSSRWCEEKVLEFMLDLVGVG
jgi:hypothetical protein